MKSSDFLTEKDEAEVETVEKENYGQELILDFHEVPSDFFTDKNVRHFAESLCDEIGMRRGPIVCWGQDKALKTMSRPKADGISVCQFLYESSIVVHAIDELHKVFVNVFSCKSFDADTAIKFAKENISGKIVSIHNMIRK
jgi:S-adenosylmethionine/arginine decarboxylase-like enzyme